MNEEQRQYTKKIMIDSYYSTLNLLLERLKDGTMTRRELRIFFELLATGELDVKIVEDAV